MISRVDIKWNDHFENDGVLYFLQRIVEMLDYSSIDIFRAPLLNTCRLIDEFIAISNGASKPYHLEEVFHEFMWSFENDIILDYKLGGSKKEQIIKKLNDPSRNRKTFMLFLQQSVSRQYLSWVIDYISKAVPENKHKKRIEKAIRCLIPELLREGYSRDEIYRTAKSLLFADDPANALSIFLSRFDCKKHSYSVYLGVSEKLIRFKDILSKKLGICFVDDGCFKEYESIKGYQTVKLSDIWALDASKAATIAIDRINLFSSFYQYFGNYSGKLVQREALVIPSEGTERTQITNRDTFTIFGNDNSPLMGELSEMIITRLINNANCSIHHIREITDLHNQAISNNGLKNGFLNLWSILEMLCVSNPDDSKIDSIIAQTVPVLKNDFWSSYLHDIADNMKRVLSQDYYQSMIEKIIDGNNEDEKIACMIFLKQYSGLLDSVIDNLQSYPVLRSRILDLHDNHKTRKDIASDANQYARRITWHLYRLYRARNQITHSGKKPADLKDLGEHLHTYVCCLANEVIISLALKPLCHIPNVFIDLELEYETKDQYFLQNAPIDNESISKLFPSYYSFE